MTIPRTSPSAPKGGAAVTDPVLLYDGHCGFCDRTVRFMLARDPGGRMRFAPLEGEFTGAFFTRHPEVRSIDSLILIEPGGVAGAERVRMRSDAAIALLEYLGGSWALARALRIVPRSLRDRAYDVFARFRYRLFGRFDACPIPAPEVRQRFLS